MEIFGGFMVMMSILSFFLAVVWLVMPFVVFAIKGKQDRMLEVLEAIEKRLAALESSLKPLEAGQKRNGPAGSSGESSLGHPLEGGLARAEAAEEKNSPEALPAE